MGFQFNGTQANVAISGGVTISKNTCVAISNTQTGTASTVIGTVPANKVWRIVAVAATAGNQGAASICSSNVLANGNVILRCVGVVSATSGGSSAVSISTGYGDAIVLAAGQTVVHTMGEASSTGSGTVWYVEEAA